MKGDLGVCVFIFETLINNTDDRVGYCYCSQNYHKNTKHFAQARWLDGHFHVTCMLVHHVSHLIIHVSTLLQPLDGLFVWDHFRWLTFHLLALLLVVASSTLNAIVYDPAGERATRCRIFVNICFHNSVDISSPDGSAVPYWIPVPSLFWIPLTFI